jgi:hypothetical protein
VAAPSVGTLSTTPPLSAGFGARPLGPKAGIRTRRTCCSFHESGSLEGVIDVFEALLVLANWGARPRAGQDCLFFARVGPEDASSVVSEAWSCVSAASMS